MRHRQLSWPFPPSPGRVRNEPAVILIDLEIRASSVELRERGSLRLLRSEYHRLLQLFEQVIQSLSHRRVREDVVA